MTPRTIAAGLIALVPVAPCAAIIIQGTELPPYIQVTTQLGVGYGATFASQNLPYVTFSELIPGVWGVQGCEPFANPMAGYAWFNAPIIINFVDPANGVTPAVVNGTITTNWGDGGGDLDAVDLKAYDLSGNLISVNTFTGNTFTQIQVTGSGIHRLEFWANTNVGSPTSDTGFDWISYPTPVVPAPGGVGFLAAAGLLAARRPRP